MLLRPSNSLPIIAALFLAACGTGSGNAVEEPASRSDVGLFTTLPIYWGEDSSVTAIIDGGGEKDWVRTVLEQRFRIAPLDALEPDTLQGVEKLILAQPRPLAPSENVALDDWVRGGGRVLLFADPMLTRHSDYAIGDKRRPQDVVLISPILARWGLQLGFDEEQPAGERWEKAFDAAMPVNLAGRFTRVEPGAPADCTVSETGVLARCTIGKGRVTVIADAALLDPDGDALSTDGKRRSALDRLIATSLDS
ncbi:DUF4350 domain-containing protein [Qipengyuania zhejiangensis]|uniref:DUF4350 domain-containing protein n=1 Tax=Qipengyuania zhejiangensis TaxID=3077782 RepID=UPI002D76665B|nr:DUF4350 domain-containing protein [Qipengyuania sp. Z2]